MENYFDNPEFSDLRLKLTDAINEEVLIYVHRIILVSHSAYFRKLSEVGFRYRTDRFIVLQVPNVKLATDLVRTMYSKNLVVAKQLTDSWLIVESKEEDPYPGVKSQFFAVKTAIVDAFEYQSRKKESTITSFRLMQNRLRAEFNDATDDFKQNLIKLGVNLNGMEFTMGFCDIDTENEIKIMLNFILQNNSFDKEDLEMLKRFC